MMRNVLSLFSGAMGLDIGLEQAGLHVAASVEIDPAACRTIRANRPDLPLYEGDVFDLSGGKLLELAGVKAGEVFAIVGGPPCQAFSTAGRRRGTADERGNVILSFVRLVREIQPAYFVMENVRGLLSMPLGAVPEGHEDWADRVHVKGSLLAFLAERFVELGYDVSFGLLSAANYGVPQKRERVIVIGSRDGGRVPLPDPTHAEREGMGALPYATFAEAVSGLGDRHAEHAPLSAKTRRFLDMLGPGQYWKHLPEHAKAEAMGGALHTQGGRTGFYRRLAWDRPAPTLVTHPAQRATLLAHPSETRALSVGEYARVQQFPDDFEFIGSPSDCYRQIGNAVPVGLGRVIGRTLINHSEGDFDPERESSNQLPYSRYRRTCDWEFLPDFTERAAQQS
jgi:DNA (cytosine-5)-methyltransferase 1